MALFGITDVTFAILLAAGTGAMVAGFVAFVVMWVPDHVGSFYFCEVYQERDGKFYQVAVKRTGLGMQSFTLGKNYQFVIPTPAPVVFYRNSRPVLQYVLNKARPRFVEMPNGEKVESKVSRKTVDPERVAVKTPKGLRDKKAGEKLGPNESPDTESRSVNLFFRRGAFEQMLRATRNVSFKDVLPIIIIMLITGVMVGYVIFFSFHPGMVTSPPAGYYYKACPIPTNATLGHIAGAVGC